MPNSRISVIPSDPTITHSANTGRCWTLQINRDSFSVAFFVTLTYRLLCPTFRLLHVLPLAFCMSYLPPSVSCFCFLFVPYISLSVGSVSCFLYVLPSTYYVSYRPLSACPTSRLLCVLPPALCPMYLPPSVCPLPPAFCVSFLPVSVCPTCCLLWPTSHLLCVQSRPPLCPIFCLQCVLPPALCVLRPALEGFGAEHTMIQTARCCLACVDDATTTIPTTYWHVEAIYTAENCLSAHRHVNSSGRAAKLWALVIA